MTVVIASGRQKLVMTHCSLSQTYGFTPKNIYQDALQGFTAELTHQMIAHLRCDPAVRLIEENGYVPMP